MGKKKKKINELMQNMSQPTIPFALRPADPFVEVILTHDTPGLQAGSKVQPKNTSSELKDTFKRTSRDAKQLFSPLNQWLIVCVSHSAVSGSLRPRGL